VLKRNLYSKKVLLSRCRIVNDLELDILVIECLVVSFRFARLVSIIIIISTIKAMLEIELNVVRTI
jgi:hypothetical protein